MGRLFVFSGPVSAEREEEYNEWYDEVHIPEVCGVEGIVAAQRFVAADGQPYNDPPTRYVAVYEFAGDTQAALAAMNAAAATFDMSDAIDLESTQAFVMEERGERYAP